MIGLALDTSTHRTLACICAEGHVIAGFHSPHGSPQHGKQIVPILRDLLREANLQPSSLRYLAVGLGPGSFTGLRIGLTAIKTLAYAWSKPLVGLDSLETIAWSHASILGGFSVIADAQRGDVFVECFERRESGRPPWRERGMELVTLADWLESGAARFPILAAQARNSPGGWAPVSSEGWREGTLTPEGLAELAHHAFLHDQVVDPWFTEPSYGRKSAAEEKAARSAER